MNRNRMIRLAGIVLISIGALACGEDDPDNNGNTNIIDGNGSTVNNTSTNVMTNNNNSTSNNNSTTGANNVVTNPDCIALNPALEGECDVLCQTGCTVSEACTAEEVMPDPEGEGLAMWTSSCAAPGASAEGAACESNTDCEQGFGCVEPRDGGAAACLQYCRTTGLEAPQCAQGLECVPFRTELRIGTCQPAVEGCTIFPDSCGDGEQCIDDGPGAECAEYGTIGREETCSESAECEEDYRCAEVPTLGKVCTTICDPSVPAEQSSCPTGESCNVVQDGSGNDLTWGVCY